MRCIAVINQKGGVGKTTTTVNLGAALARKGHKVLLIDMDPQSSLSLHIDRIPQNESESVTHLLLEEAPLAPLVQTTAVENMWVVPADSALGGVEQVLANKLGREMLLREAFEKYDGEVEFDFILLDCPPSLGVLSANALVAADEVVIPMRAEYLSLQGMAKLTEVIELVRARLNPELKIACVLPCMLDVRTRLSAEVLEEIESHFGTLVSQFPIRANVKLAEAPSFGCTIFEHDPECNGAEDYEGLAAELLGEEIEWDEDEEAEDADEVEETELESEDDVEDEADEEDEEIPETLDEILAELEPLLDEVEQPPPQPATEPVNGESIVFRDVQLPVDPEPFRPKTIETPVDLDPHFHSAEMEA